MNVVFSYFPTGKFGIRPDKGQRAFSIWIIQFWQINSFSTLQHNEILDEAQWGVQWGQKNVEKASHGLLIINYQLITNGFWTVNYEKELFTTSTGQATHQDQFKNLPCGAFWLISLACAGGSKSCLQRILFHKNATVIRNAHANACKMRVPQLISRIL